MGSSTHFTKDEISQYFNFPINEAANKLGICPTILKKSCREYGITRWPYRKIKSIDSLIEDLQNVIKENNGEEPTVNMNMKVLLEKKKKLLDDPNVSYKSVVPKYCINTFRAQIQKAKEDIEKKSKYSDLPIKKQSMKRRKPAELLKNSIDFTNEDDFAVETLNDMKQTKFINVENDFDTELQKFINESVKYERLFPKKQTNTNRPFTTFFNQD